MYLQYANKRSEEDILVQTPKAILKNVCGRSARNKLIQGDNLPILYALMEEYQGKVDLVYIDPPFGTNGAFRIGMNRANAISYSRRDKLAYTDSLIGTAFLEFLRPRLIFLRELLSEQGSIYLHIDYKIGHHVKIIMDEIFGSKNFRNDITRVKCNPKNFQRKGYGNIKDMILFYSKSKDMIWNDPKVPFTSEEIERLFRKKDEHGRRYTTIPLHAPGETLNGDTGKAWRGIKPPKGRHWRSAPSTLEAWEAQGLIEWSRSTTPRKKIFADESTGKRMQDIWEFKDPQYPLYPTQKNLDLLHTIITASSCEDDLVLDCFCGAGTTLVSAGILNRRWLGIDRSKPAIDVTRKRLEKIPKDLFLSIEYEFWQSANNQKLNLYA